MMHPHFRMLTYSLGTIRAARSRSQRTGYSRTGYSRTGRQRQFAPCRLVSTVICLISLLFVAAAHGEQQHSQPDDEPGAREQIVLDLSKKETFALLSVNADAQDVWITDIEVTDLPTAYRLVPASGTARLGSPLNIQFQEPDNVRIRLAVVKRGKELALRISPEMVCSQNNVIDLTQDRITRSSRKLRRRIKNVRQQLAALTRERQALNLWLLSPGNKPLETVKSARLRIKILDQTIKAGLAELPLAQRQCIALGQIAELIKALHKNVTIHFTIKVI